MMAKRGRLVKCSLPDSIDAKPEDVARAAFQASPKTEWRFGQEPGRSVRRKLD